jgi:S-adenosylmethionine hydrolase
MTEPLISFLSDYGLQDEFVGVCHGVIAARCPRARVIDLAHCIPRHDVLAGALTLRGALDYVPADVHLAVVDPDVGASTRRAVAIRTRERALMLVGPDNGLLMLAAERLGGAEQAVEISASRERRVPVSGTFHGRDIFAPVAAAIADGASLQDVGEPLAVAALTRLQVPAAHADGGVLRVRVLIIDGFGNLATSASSEQVQALLPQDGGIMVRSGSGEHRGSLGRVFADVPAGALVLYRDAQGMVALAVNRGSAAELLAAAPGDELLLWTA